MTEREMFERSFQPLSGRTIHRGASMTHYSRIVRMTERGRTVAEVYRHHDELRVLVERKSFGSWFFNKPLVNHGRAHEWADARIAICEWFDGHQRGDES